jgi:hypothetical protein
MPLFTVTVRTEEETQYRVYADTPEQAERTGVFLRRANPPTPRRDRVVDATATPAEDC